MKWKNLIIAVFLGGLIGGIETYYLPIPWGFLTSFISGFAIGVFIQVKWGILE